VVAGAAVRADLTDLVHDDRARSAVERVTAPIRLLRAPHGLYDTPYPVIPHPILEAFLNTQPDAHVENVPDVNHYTIALGTGPGPRAVAAALIAAARDAVN
jgi:hypothetical protein